MPQVLILLPANTYRASRFLEAAKKLNLEIVIATDSDFSPPDYSESIIDGVDFFDPESAGRFLAKEALARNISRIVAVDEAGVEVAEWIRAIQNGTDNPNPGVLATRDKRQLRTLLAKSGIIQPRQYFNLGLDELNQSDITFPVVVKPTKSSGSLGVTRANNHIELLDSIKIATQAIQQTNIQNQSLIVEEYIHGSECAIEIIVENGIGKILAIFEKPDPLEGPAFAETIYLTPPRFDAKSIQELESTVAACVDALNITEGPLHIELRKRDGLTWVPIDIASRSIGGNCSDALNFSDNVSLEELILQNALSIDTKGVQRERQASGVFMLPVDKPGTLVKVTGVEAAKNIQFIQKVDITLAVGTKVEPLPNDNQYIGFIFAKAPGATAVEKALRDARAQIIVHID